MVIASKIEVKMNGNSKQGNKGATCDGNDNGNPPAHKKAKTASLLSQVLNKDVYTPEREKILAEDYIKSKPYHHSKIEDLFDVDFLTKVKEQIKQNSKVNFKETDLFRVYQSIDLANLEPNSELASNMPSVMQLREVLYSMEWRSFMERITNVPPGTLLAQVDCACNCHAPGCHLLCHDDVIGTRKISYILYLTEPDWSETEGGALELYDSHPADDSSQGDGDCALRREPNNIPALNVMPTFNSMAFFVVEPGVSFHAVQEVLGERPRLSIQGWYHAAALPDHMEHATLSRLKESNGANTGCRLEEFLPWKDERIQPLERKRKQRAANADKLSDVDRDYLALYINETYLTKTAMEEIRQRFEEDSSVQLKHFFRTSWTEKLMETTTDHDGETRPQPGREGYYEWGVSDEWKLVGPPHKRRYLQYQEMQDYSASEKVLKQDPISIGQPPKDATSAGDLLSRLKQNVMQSPAFGRYLNYITSLGVPTGYKGQIRRFRPGLDYTVAHHGLLTQTAVLDATVCFAAGTGGVGTAPLEDQEEGGAEEARNTADSMVTKSSAAALISNEKSDKLSRVDDDDEELDEADMLWQSDDVGGFECYIEADDYDSSFKDGEGNFDKEKQEVAKMSESADEYNEDDDTSLLSVSASNNTLSLVYRDPGTMRFIKYVGSRAPSSRWDISMVYQVPEEHEDDARKGGNEQFLLLRYVDSISCISGDSASLVQDFEQGNLDIEFFISNRSLFSMKIFSGNPESLE